MAETKHTDCLLPSRGLSWTIQIGLTTEPYISMDIQSGAEFTSSHTFEYDTMSAEM